jgi:polysaccharide biosynthesis/export protein
LKFLFLLILTVSLASGIQAQNGSSQRAQTTGSSAGGFSIPGVNGIYYIDEVGLRLATEGIPLEGFIDSDTYIMGAMDVVSIEAAGTIPVVWRGLVVNAEGFVTIPSVGHVQVGDLSLREAREKIKALVARSINSDEITVTLELPKPVNVHMIGAFPRASRYTFPAGIRADAAIISLLMGVPEPTSRREPVTDSEETSTSQSTQSRQPERLRPVTNIKPVDLSDFRLRNTEILHRNGTVTQVDIIAYMNNGNLQENPVLRDGDMITVRRRTENDERISVSGSVRVSIDADHRFDDTPATLFRLSGGYTSAADTTHFFILRLENGVFSRLRINESLRADSTTRLLPNDRIVVPQITPYRLNESARVSGEIQIPGNYPILGGRTTLRELLEVAGPFTSRALPSAAYIQRGNQQNENDLDSYTRQMMLERTADQLTDGIEYLRAENALISQVLFVDLRDTIHTGQVLLMDGDRVHIPANDNTVMLMGQVNRTGYYPFVPGNDVTSYLALAGGLTHAAETSRIFVIKAGSREWYRPENTVIESGDIIFVDRVPLDDFISRRTFEQQQLNLELQKENFALQKRYSRYQIVISTVSTITSIVLTYIALSRN